MAWNCCEDAPKWKWSGKKYKYNDTKIQIQCEDAPKWKWSGEKYKYNNTKIQIQCEDAPKWKWSGELVRRADKGHFTRLRFRNTEWKIQTCKYNNTYKYKKYKKIERLEVFGSVVETE